jgi:hypothetical protein
MKISPVGAELFHTEGQTDMLMLIVTFHNFANELKVIIGTEREVLFYLFYNLRKGIIHNMLQYAT